MPVLKNILHPTDFSRLAACASELAQSFARDYGARVTVVHVKVPVGRQYEVLPSEADLAAEKQEDRRQLEEKLRQIIQTDPLAAPMECRLEEASRPAEGILKVAKEINADLIVMGTHGRTWVSQALLGSVAEQVLRNAPCPVVVTKVLFSDTLSPDLESLRGEVGSNAV